MPDELKLFVYILGAHSTFPVDIQSAETVGDLKKSILKEKPNKLKDVDADELTLHKVSLPNGNTLAESAPQALHEKLDIHSRMLSKYFQENPSEETVRIVAVVALSDGLAQGERIEMPDSQNH